MKRKSEEPTSANGLKGRGMSKESNDYGDIDYWYVKNKGICNHCGLDMKKLHPATNIYPHFTGECNPELNCDRVVTQIQGKKCSNLPYKVP